MTRRLAINDRSHRDIGVDDMLSKLARPATWLRAARRLSGVTPMRVRAQASASLCQVRAIASGENKSRWLHKATWYRGLPDEIEWWDNYLLNDPVGRQWQVESQDPMWPVQDSFVARHLGLYAARDVKILDVGAGPITKIGYHWPGKTLDIVPIDPLADHYERLLKHNGINLPFRTQSGDGETLLLRFKPESFDFAYACNSLDHSYDPVAIIGNMLAVVKKGGIVLLRHFRNEGAAGHYDGLHQWNFDLRDGRFVVWSRDSVVDVDAALGHDADIKTEIEPAGVFDDWNECVLVAMTKR